MRSISKTSLASLVLVASAALSVGGPAIALASSGGTSAPGPATPAKKVHPSGIATWFGPGFYGKKTACGQMLTPNVVGVANRTLPCGTLVKVGYKGHTLTVPVLDRGPYAHHADWDLTAGAAEALGITETVRVSTSVVGSEPNSPTLGQPVVAPSTVVAGGASAG
ncbi:MAG TPA: septal ring lytic transglycosylase RlpA family protein [Solirubrobacteraceae bacterium]|jgi:rare lipoprotein A (peptidoglycan hydrolase)